MATPETEAEGEKITYYQILVRREAVEEKACLAGAGIRKRRSYPRLQLERHTVRFPNFKLTPAGRQCTRKQKQPLEASLLVLR